MTRPVRRASLLASVVLMGASLLVGCDAPTGSVAPTPTRAPEPTSVTTTYPLGTDVWYEGLVLHMDLATTVLDSRGGTVDVAFRIENPTDDESDLDARMTLVVGGNRIEATRESHVPTAEPRATALALVSFELQGIASAGDAVLEIGADPDHIAKVPFTTAGGAAVTFEPRELALKGAASAGDLRITARHAQVRWDLPDYSQEMVADLRVLTVTYDVTYNGTFSGGFAFTGDNVALRLPDGKKVEARTDGHSQSIELVGARKTKRNLFTRFEIPADATGKFALLVRNGSTEQAIAFTIDG